MNMIKDVAHNYYDLNGLNQLKLESRMDKDEALQKTAEQFEALFIQMVFKSMREATEAMADENSFLSSESLKFYQDMQDQQLSVNLSSGKAFGLAELLVKQLKGL